MENADDPVIIDRWQEIAIGVFGIVSRGLADYGQTWAYPECLDHWLDSAATATTLQEFGRETGLGGSIAPTGLSHGLDATGSRRLTSPWAATRSSQFSREYRRMFGAPPGRGRT